MKHHRHKSILSVYLLLSIILSSIFALSSCSEKDENTSLDVSQEVESFRNILASAPNGWHMQYFPELNHTLFSDLDENIKTEDNALVPRVLVSRYGVGGYNLFLKFQTDGTMQMLTDIPYYPTDSDIASFYKPSFNRNISNSLYDIKIADGLNLIFTTNTMLDELSQYRVHATSRFSPVSVSADSIVLRTANYLTGNREYIIMKPLDSSVEWQNKMDRLINQKETFRTRFYATPQQITLDRRRCILEVLVTATATKVYETTGDADIAYDYAPKRLSTSGWADVAEARRIARYDRLQYDLFVKNERPDLGEYSRMFTGLGSGYIATEEGIEFKPGIRYDENVVFTHFRYRGQKEWTSVVGPFTARIFLR